ncbi:lysosomal thioesterase PPT2 [Haemorhous mexicanus]|uniref:lysosomal thioesterase PPT2 n=1 Tax=Haemorhous mexicanus TaxID=30427 RepID=UPI0028BE146E|nr:lysosomal thioesterase PPT2 [Haemorhous mexicanus]
MRPALSRAGGGGALPLPPPQVLLLLLLLLLGPPLPLPPLRGFGAGVAGVGAGGPFRPVVIVHGLFDSPSDFRHLRQFINESHPGTEVTVLDLFDRGASLRPLWLQVAGFRQALASDHGQRRPRGAPAGLQPGQGGVGVPRPPEGGEGS